MLRCLAGRFFLFLFSSVILPLIAVCGQTTDAPSRFGATFAPYSCRASLRAQRTESNRSWPLHETVRDWSAGSCAPPPNSPDLPSHRPAAAMPPQSGSTSQTVDPELQQLAAMGAEGWTIAIARQEVLDILERNNSCSAWYASVEPDPARKFASLSFLVDHHGAASVLSRYDPKTGSYYLEPYVARAQQDVGAGSTITLNAHGAFFVSRAPFQIASSVGAVPLGGRVLLHVSDFVGGSLRAQVTTFLHEYAHIVGLLPVDAGEEGSPQLSTQNTETVLGWCRKQVQASPGRSIILDAPLAALEPQARNH